MRILLVFILVYFAIFTNLASASNNYSPEVLINLALKNHPNVKAYQEILKGASAQKKGAMWNYFPTPSVSAYNTRDGKYGTTLAIEQPIWTGGKIDAHYKMAVGQEKEAQYMLYENNYALVEAVIIAMQSYIQFSQSAIALEEGRNELKMLEAMLDRRIQAGVSPRSDMELLKSRISQIEIDLNLAKTKEQTSLGQLALLTGRSYGADLRINDTVLPNHNGSLEDYFIRMEETHPALKKISAQTQTAQAEKQNAKAVFWPNVSIRAEQQIRGASIYDNDKTNDSSVYISVQASPGAGLSAFSGVQQSEAKIMQFEYEKISKKQDLMDAMIIAFNDYHSTSSRYSPQQSTINSSGKVMESYTRLFLAGKRQWLDLVNASRELTNNKMAFAELKATRLASAYRLALLKGDIVNETKENTPSVTSTIYTIPAEDIASVKPSENVIVGESKGGIVTNQPKKNKTQDDKVDKNTHSQTTNNDKTEKIAIGTKTTNVNLKEHKPSSVQKNETSKPIIVAQASNPKIETKEYQARPEQKTKIDKSTQNTNINIKEYKTKPNHKQEENIQKEYFIQVETNKLTQLSSNTFVTKSSRLEVKEYKGNNEASAIPKLEAKGIGYMVVDVGGFSKVLVGPYETKSEAVGSLAIVKKEINKEAFIVQQN